MLAIALAASLLAAEPPPDLRAPRPELDSSVSLGGGVRRFDPGPFRAGELMGAGVGVVAGDAAVMAAAYGTYQLFVKGALAPTVGNFRWAAYGLGAAALLLPPLGAVIGGNVARSGPAAGAAWKAFLLSLAGHAAALAVGYLAAPSYWAVLPAQLATMTTGTSVGLHWGPRGREDLDARVPEPRVDEAAPVAFTGAPICPDQGA
jgi:hypothetical protein